MAITVFGGIILYVGKPLFIPLSFALFISLILVPLCNRLEKFRTGRVGAILISLLLLTVLMFGFLYVLYTQFRNFAHEWTFLSSELRQLLAAIKISLTSDLGIPKPQVDAWFTDLTNSVGSKLFGMLEVLIGSFIINMVMLVLVPIYAFLILFYRHHLVEALYSFFPVSNRQKIAEVISLSIKTYYNFIVGMALVYLIVGIMNSLGLLILGVPHAFLFGFFTAIMTFIPYVGIIIAAMLPITYAWITYNSIFYPLGVIVVFTLVQYLEANIIFPWAVGHKLNLNPLVTLIIIIIGGIMWGGSGMILFLPFAAILKLIADRVPGWQPLSDLMGNSKARLK